MLFDDFTDLLTLALAADLETALQQAVLSGKAEVVA